MDISIAASMLIKSGTISGSVTMQKKQSGLIYAHHVKRRWNVKSLK